MLYTVRGADRMSEGWPGDVLVDVGDAPLHMGLYVALVPLSTDIQVSTITYVQIQ